MLIKRTIEKRIKKLSNMFPAIGILGPRQIGKTTIAKNIILNKEKTYLDLESTKDINKLDDPEFFFNLNTNKCVILDEIQRMPELFPILRGVIDQKRVSARFMLLGSASPDILKKSTETLAGRIAYVELTGLNILEVKGIIKLYDHWLKGGFPEALLSKNDDFHEEWYRFFINTYIERDLPNLGLRVSSKILLRFIKMIAHNHGSLWNASTFSNSLGVTSPTVTNYVSFLENTYSIRLLSPYFINIKKRIIKSPKIYIRDNGILHSLLGLNSLQDLMSHPIAGHSWEGYVIEQIISVSQNLYEHYFYRTQNGAECDLVIVKGDKPIMSIEIKLTLSPKKTKSFTQCINDLNSINNFIIIPECDEPYKLSDKILVCDLETFLEEYLTKSYL